MKVKARKLDLVIKKSCNSNIAKSCRRIFFNYLNNPNTEEVPFHVDIMFGGGSGALIRYNKKYFLLTAKHVIENNLKGNYQNNSPFWVSTTKNPKWQSLHDFMFPKIMWNIGELIDDTSKLINDTDVCLIELFYPQPFHMPDHFIEINEKLAFLEGKEFFEGQMLICNGYPMNENGFDHTYEKDGFTHSTNINRASVVGICKDAKTEPYISFEITDTEKKSSNDHNGMSGGVVYNVMPKGNQVRWAGMILSGGNGITRFLPAHRIYPAILAYEKSSHHIIDPAAERAIDPETALKLAYDYFIKFSKKAKEKHEPA